MREPDDRIPGRLLKQWAIRDAVPLADTVTSRIWRVRLANGGTAIVKSLKPAGDEEIVGADFLAWRDGAGAIRLLARDGTNYLLEDAGDRTLLGHLNQFGDMAATGVAIEVMRCLHEGSDRTEPSTLQPLEERYRSLFRLVESDSAVPSLYREGAALGRTLLANQRDARPLHGDLHHENILHGSRGWLAIDAKGVFGDPAFDAANLFYNPVERTDLRTDPDRHSAMADPIAAALGRDRQDILAHAFAWTCLSASWHREDGNHAEEARSLAVTESLRPLLKP